MNKIKGFTFYKSYYESLKNLKEKDKKEIINAILEYVFEDKKPNFSGIKYTIWALIEPNLNTSKHRSNDNSGAPEGNQNACKYKENQAKSSLNNKQSKNNQKTTNDLYDKDKEIDKDKDKERECDNISAPTLTSIISFGEELGVDEEYCRRFFNNYESTGWKIGKNYIENWKAKFEQWVEQDLKSGTIKLKSNKEEYDTRKFFEDENGKLFKYDSKGGKHYV